jgi:predicted ester cyclase
MSVENKAIVRRWFDAFNRGDLNAGAQCLDAGCVLHAPGGDVPGIEGWKQFAGMYRTAFPDCELHIEDILVDGDQVIVRFTARGTHRGDLAGVAPTGRQVAMPCIMISKVVKQKIVESWEVFDQLGLFQTLGSFPPAPAAA